jgi:DNA (cytosine-5)-methyltransferase 1
MTNKRKLNFIDLFSGAGGLSYGLEKAGLNCLVGIDFLEPAIETFNHNHPNSIGICGDLKEISPADIKKMIGNKKVDLICGGPPCQGFSTIGPGNANDDRNHLFYEFLKFVEFFKPNHIMIENVTGLVARKNENTLLSIFDSFKKLGYELDIRVLTASHYGVPEARRRVIILGNNKGKENFYPEKKFANYGEVNKKLKPVRTVGWAFENLMEFRKKTHNHDVDAAFIKSNLEQARIDAVPEGKAIRYERDEKAYLPEELWFDHDWNTMSEKRFREAKFARLDRAKPSPTIVTNAKMYYHPTDNRYLTAREAAALQSFPAKFVFKGSLSKQWTQIGNAVPPIMAEELGKAVLKSHASRKKKKKDTGPLDFEQIRSYAFKYDKDTFDNSSAKQKELNL